VKLLSGRRGERKAINRRTKRRPQTKRLSPAKQAKEEEISSEKKRKIYKGTSF